jgi:predicted Zn finger-like uncharacterized protein
MRFSCDRCKTRYSIAEDRVRGKILRIRCKNCSEVITVRGERPRTGGDEASDARVKPAWFLAVGGIQHGPMSLTDAMAWVTKREPTELIYGWSEGFEGWRSVDELEHFADLREPPPPGEEPNFEGDTVIAPPTYGEDEVLERGGDAGDETRGAVAESMAAGPGGEPTESGALAASNEPGSEAANLELPDGDPGAADFRIGRGRSVMPLVLVVLILAAGGAAAYLLLAGGEETPPAAEAADAAPLVVEIDAAPLGPRVALEPIDPIGADASDAEAGEGDAGAAPRSLGELLAAYDEHAFLITRCFTRAIDDDPDLDIATADLSIEIAPTGRVAEVGLSELEGTELGACIESRIRGWQLRSAPDRFEGAFRLRFIR